MRSNYKPLGKYIQPVVGRNNDLGDLPLVGLSIQKKFIPSIANTIGTDMSTYRIIEKNQFAYGPVTSRNGDKITIALFNDYERALISQAYTPFEVKDTTDLDPEYLMMWFRRPEFDRYARFKSHGSAREIFDWEEMCNTLLPVPHITKQREIVKEYNVIQNRIALNQQLIQKLEETAQAIYKQWFVDFEFPFDLAMPEALEGRAIDYSKGYKSNGGEMVWNEEFGKEIPKGWEVGCLEGVVNNFISKRGKSKSTMNLQEYSQEFKFPVISAMNINNGRIVKYETIPFVNIIEYNAWMNPKLEIDDVLLTSEAPLGETYYLAVNADLALSQRLFAIRTMKEKLSGWFLYLWLNTPFAKQEMEGRSSGTTVFGIKLSELRKLNILIPEHSIESRFNHQTKSIAKLTEIKNKENQKLTELKDLLLSKLATV
jgi:type I restriction enzyme S subunit